MRVYVKDLNLFTYAGHPRLSEIRKIRALADLKAADFSVITYSGNGWHWQHVAPMGIRTLETSQLRSVWKMLASHRGDLVIEWPRGAWPDIRAIGAGDRVLDTGITVAQMPFHLLIRKGLGQPALLPAFNRTIRDMDQDGTLAAILGRYP